MSVRVSIFFLLSAILMLGSCRRIPNPFLSDQALVKVGDRTLYMSEILPLLPQNVSAEDSVRWVDSYMDSWIRKELKIDVSEDLLSDAEQKEIAQKMQDYKYTLLNYKMEQCFVENRLDTAITKNNIESYYNAHKSEFILDRVLVKGVVVRLPKSFRQKSDLKDLMRSSEPERREDLKVIVLKNNLQMWSFDAWTEFGEFASLIPASKSNQNKMLTDNSVWDYQDEDSNYIIYSCITRSLKPGDYLPVEMDKVQDNIKKIIANQRRIDIIKSVEDSLYRDAVKNKKIVIYDK